MAGRSRRLTSYRRRGRPVSDQDLGDVCAIFTRDEIAGWFREWEATLVETVNKAVEQAKRTREAEFPLPPEDDARDRPPQPLVTMSQREADESVDETTR